jgi:hypothetical protein
MIEREWMTEFGRQLALKRLQIRPKVNLGNVKFFEESLDQNIFTFLIAQLHRYGNIPSLTQLDALWRLCKAYSGMAKGEFRGRFAFPLPCGAGKTLSVVAFCQALLWLDGLGMKHETDGVSVLVSASKVEALCQLKRDLIRAGVSDDWIGLFHSYQFRPDKIGQDGYASEPDTGDYHNKRILLCTHNRVRGKTEETEYYSFKGRKRTLVIYDESLIKSESWAIRIEDIKSGIGHYKPKVNNNETGRKAIAYLEKAVKIFEAEVKRQDDENRPDVIIHLPELSGEQIQTYKNSFFGIYEHKRDLQNLLAVSQDDIRVLRTQQGDGFVTFEPALNQDLDNIIVLDASHTLRDVLKYDKDLRGALGEERFKVSYRNLTINHLKHYSGRTSIEDAFKSRERKLSLEIAEVIHGIPDDEGILIFIFKRQNKSSPNVENILIEDIRDAGVNPDAKIKVKEGDRVIKKDRINFLTWGNETSLNSYSFCRNVICVGILHRAHLEIGSLITGQADDLALQISKQDIQEAVKGECCHVLYQALCRGSIRKIIGEETEPMNAWVIDKINDIRKRLDRVLPGAVWKKWKPKYIEIMGKAETLAEEIREYLDENGVMRISTMKLKREMNLNDVASRTFTRAIEILTQGMSEWDLEKRSLVRFRPFAGFATGKADCA